MLAIGVSLVATIVLVWLLLQQIRAKDIIESFQMIPLGMLITALVLYCTTYLFRALRFRLLLEKAINLGRLVNIVAVQNLIGNLVPLRVGELSLVYLNKKAGVRGTKSLAVLIIARVFDLAVLSGFLMLSLLFLEGAFIPKGLVFGLGAITLGAFIALLAMLFLKEKFLLLTEKIFSIMHLQRSAFFQKVKDHIIDTIHGFEVIRGKREAGATFLLTLAAWVPSFLLFFLLVQALGLRLGFWQVVFFNVFQIFLPMIPVYGIGGFGTTEGYLTVMLILFGIGKDQAILSSFVLHIIILGFTVLVGAIGLIGLYSKHKNYGTVKTD